MSLVGALEQRVHDPQSCGARSPSALECVSVVVEAFGDEDVASFVELLSHLTSKTVGLVQAWPLVLCAAHGNHAAPSSASLLTTFTPCMAMLQRSSLELTRCPFLSSLLVAHLSSERPSADIGAGAHDRVLHHGPPILPLLSKYCSPTTAPPMSPATS